MPPFRQSAPANPRRHATWLGAVLAGLLAVAAALVVPPTVGAAEPVSPLLWGENLALDSNSGTGDWFLGSPALRQALKTAHTQIIRMPVRGPHPDQAGFANRPEFTAAAQHVRQLGMAPLVILRNPEAPQALETDLEVVRFMRDLFAGQPVYYEFGNETDMHFDPDDPNYVPPESYVAKWNQFIPVLKAAAGPGARFIGPVSFEYDDPYLRTFLRGANPRPDAVSWHMYTCKTTEPKDNCLGPGGLDDWPGELAAARTLMSEILGTRLDIWITEWNFNPHSDIREDLKLNDQDFLRQWTRKALRTLAEGGVVASMHYNVERAVPLATADGALTTQGQAFKDTYEELATSPSSPSPPSPSPPSPSPSPSTPGGTTPRYSFEDGGLSGWSGTGDISSLSSSTQVGGQHGGRALKVVFGDNYPYVHAQPPDGPASGSTLSAYVYLPASVSKTVTVRLYVQDSAYQWHSGATTVGPRDTWVGLTYRATVYAGRAIQVGVQFDAQPAGSPTVIYLDSITWS